MSRKSNRSGRKRKPKAGGRASPKGRTRRLLGFVSLFLFLFLTVWALAGSWYVHHPAKWLERHSYGLPGILAAPLVWMGEPVGDFLDALGLAGHDAVYEYDTEAPSGEIAFAGLPRRVGPPAPDDIVVIDKGEFKIGWSPSLRHPLWCAYHVPKHAIFELGKRPNFLKDRTVADSPSSANYDKCGYDRGHLAPNFAIATRFGAEMQRNTFFMTNITPQSPALNRGVWREMEHRIAELWTARWGEIWVVVGAVPSASNHKLGTTGIDIPDKFYQVVVAQEGMDVRAFAVMYDQSAGWRSWPTRGLVTIDELEKTTGLDFMPDLPEFIQNPLEAELPSRLWPIRARDIFKKIAIRFK